MAPLNGYQVFPPRWSEHHRPVADATMTLPCRVLRPSLEPPPFGSEAAPAVEVWEGKCRLQQHNTSSDSGVTAGQAVEIRRYLAVVPNWVLPMVRGGEAGDLLEAGGNVFNVIQVMQGSQTWECDLIVQHNQTQQSSPLVVT